jgi:cell division protein FtsW
MTNISSPESLSPQEDAPAGFFIACAGMLLAVGALMVYSSSITARPSDQEWAYLSRQLLFVLAAGVLGIAASQLPAAFWRVAAPWLFAGTLVLLLLVLLPGVGRSVNGARRWFRMGPISLQPSETAKITLPLLLCSLRFRRSGVRDWGRPGMLRDLGLTGFAAALIALEPDLGTALFVTLIAGLTFWLAGCPWGYFAWAGAGFAPAGLLVLALKPYQLARIRGFMDAWFRPEDAPYQVQQSLTTLGVGGWTGVGLGRGWQKLSFLPEANTDFVYSVVGEELGLVGTLGVLLLWAGLYAAGMTLIRRLPRQSFERMAATVLLAQLTIQAAVNVAVVTALLPPKGISHPFISYGGSNLAASVLSMGIIFSLTRLPSPAPIRDNSPRLRVPSAPPREAASRHAELV